jgi:hypothetical protein
MATRLYLPSTGAAAVSPAYDSGWGDTTGADRIAAVTIKIASAMASKSFPSNSSGGLARQYVSPPMAAQTISGTVKCYLRCLENFLSHNYDGWIGIRVCNNAGTSFTGTLLATGLHGPGTDFADSLENRSFADGDTVSSLAINAGDRLVIELGADQLTGTGGGDFSFGDNSGTDLPEDETTTAANNPWLEFSMTIAWLASAQESDLLYLRDSSVVMRNVAREQADQSDLSDRVESSLILPRQDTEMLESLVDHAQQILDVYREVPEDSLLLHDSITIDLLQYGIVLAREAIEEGLSVNDAIEIAIWPIRAWIVEQVGVEDATTLFAEFFREVGDPGETYYGEAEFGGAEFGGEQWLDSLSDGASIAIQRQTESLEWEQLPDVPDTVEQFLRTFRQAADRIELSTDGMDVNIPRFYTVNAGADRVGAVSDGADVTIPSILFVPNKTRGHYRPRWLLSGTISGEVKRYSSQDLETP